MSSNEKQRTVPTYIDIILLDNFITVTKYLQKCAPYAIFKQT